MNSLVALLSVILPIVVAAHDTCCKVDGGLTEWTQYTPCSASCGLGTQTRERFCAAPYAQLGGKDCSGPLKQTKTCDLRPCPRDGGWTEWKKGKCSKTCGGGIITETRTCTNPSPAHCGKDCVGSTNRTTECNTHECPKWVWKCGDCDLQTNGACAKHCKQECLYKGKIVENWYCPGKPQQNYTNCDKGACPQFEWRYNCKNETSERCTGSLANCRQNCTQRCFNVHTNNRDDGECSGSPETKETKCYHPNPIQYCQNDEIRDVCRDCKERALKKAKTFTNSPYHQANFVGHACRDWEVQADLLKYCRDNKAKQSKNGGLPAKDWFWVHCSADGPWCKPCSTRGLVFNTKCDACEATRDGPCTGKHSG